MTTGEMIVLLWLPQMSLAKALAVVPLRKVSVLVRLLASETAPSSSEPPVTSIPPVKVLTPESRRLPVPAFTKLPVPDMTPEKVVEVLSPPALSWADPSVTLPAPAKEPTVSEKPARFQVVPEATETALPSGMTPAAPEASAPPVIATPPTKLLAPERVMVPLPCFVKAPVPDMTPE